MYDSTGHSCFLITDSDIEEFQRAYRWFWDPEPRQASASNKVTVTSDHLYSLEEVAAVLGVTRERVRQIEVIALKKARAWAEAHGYRFEDLLG